MNLLEQSLWWIVPAFLIAGFMVFAMMEFTAALLVKRPRRRSGVPAAVLRERLLALNSDEKPYRVVAGETSDLELEWDVVDATWYELFARVKLTTVYRARMLLDEARREVRWYETLRSSNVFLGFEGWKAKFNFSFYYRSGYLNVLWSGLAYGILPGFPPRIGKVYEFHLDTVAVKEEITDVIRRAGWTFRPVVFPLKMNRRWVDRFRALSPAWWNEISERRRWGTLYVGTFLLFYVYFFIALADPMVDWTWHNVGVALAVGAGWWAIWGLLTWILMGFPGISWGKPLKD